MSTVKLVRHGDGWANNATGWARYRLCGSSVRQLLEIPTTVNTIHAVFTKRARVDSFTITKPTRMPAVDAIFFKMWWDWNDLSRSYYSRLKETQANMFAEVMIRLAAEYKKGNRYVHIEY